MPGQILVVCIQESGGLPTEYLVGVGMGLADCQPNIYAVDGEVRSREINVGMKDQLALNNRMKIDTHFLYYNILPIQRVTQYIKELGFSLICK
jgi:hypothetical protein